MPELLFAAQNASQRISGAWVWYLIRGSGFAAVILLVLLMLSGIGHVTGLTYRFLEPVKAWAVHKAMGIALGIVILIHGGMLLFDHFLPFSIPQLLIPFLKTYGNGHAVFGLSLAWLSVPSGIIAAYGTYIVLFSSLDTVGWIRSRRRLWQLTHWISYLSMLLVLIHGILAGTDLKSGLLRYIWLFITIILAIGIVSRIARRNKAVVAS